jgi:integrase
MNPTEARFAAEQVKALVRDGGDPAVELREAQRNQLNASDADRPISWWLDTYVRSELGDDTRHKRYEASHVRLGLAELDIHSQPPASITEDHMKDLLQQHRDRPATARHRFGAMSRFLDFLQDQKVIQTNPARSISKKRRPKPPAPRNTFYEVDDLSRLWNPEQPLKEVYLRYLRFLITTPLRAVEAAELTVEQVNVSRMEISLSAAVTKNSEAFVMPLSKLAEQQLKIEQKTQDQRVFQLSSKGDEPMRSWSHFNASVRKSTGVQNFNLHDLRRTFSTLVAEHSEFGESLIDGLLNHKQSVTRSGAIRHYQMAKHLKRRREVIDWWGAFLQGEVK